MKTRLKLLWRFVRLLPQARALELEYQAHVQERYDLQFTFDLAKQKELELRYKQGFIEGMEWALNRFHG